MTLKIAFAGFRHGHILGLYENARTNPALEIVAACEEDTKTAQAMASGNIKLTHDNFDKMLAEVPCDIIAVGDYYAKRGALLIKAMKAGKHVIADKPICTSLAELDEIEKLAKANNLKVGCQLDLRVLANAVAARNVIKNGTIGEIHAIQFGGQHPLMANTRPSWYFEDGKHGGTINDIAIHGIDLIPWMTGLEFTEIIAARTWNAFAAHCPTFNDAAQFMLKMNNGCGILGDVSYAVPDSLGYSLPFYWRFTIWGTKGVIEFNCVDKGIKLAENGNSAISQLAAPAQPGPGYLEDFLADIDGKPTLLDTATVIKSSRQTLKIQEAADKQLFAVSL